MLQFGQSPFLQALGYTIVSSLWQFATLWLIYVVINCVLSLSSHKKHITALSLQLAGFAWFLLTLIYYFKKCSYLYNIGAVYNEELISLGQMSYTGSLKDQLLLGLLKSEAFLPYLSVAYIMVLLFLMVRWVQTYRSTNSIKYTGIEKIGFEYRLFVERLSFHLGIKQKVSVYLSHIIKSPLTIGYIKPIILIPVACLNNLAPQQVEAILLHELAHIKRADYLINIALSVIEVVLFFNPFMQLLSRHIKRERENSCDDCVLQFDYNPSNYARALLSLATYNKKASPAFTVNAVDQKHSLLIRVKRMIEMKDRTYNYRNQLFSLVGLAAIISLVAFITPNKNLVDKAITKGAKKLRYVAEPMVIKIDNPLFNPVFFLADDEEILPAITTDVAAKNADHVIQVFNINLQKQKNGQQFAEAIPASKTLQQETLLEMDSRLTNEQFDENLASFLPLQSTSNVLVQNEEGFLTHLNTKLKAAETALKHLSISQHEKFLKAREKVAVQKAIKALSANIKEISINKLHQKNVEFTALQDSAANYYKIIFNEKALKVLDEQLKSQLEAVSINKSNTGSAANWRDTDTPDIIMHSPTVKSSHTYSYDYRENPTLLRSPVARPESLSVTPPVLIDSSEDVIEIYITPPTKAKAKKVKKIIKLTKI